MNKLEFIPTIAPIVQRVNKRLGNPLYSSVVIAQAILETGWGQSSLMMKAKAIFGIKAGSSWKGKVYNANTKECYDGKTYTDIKACFRAYDSFEESIEDYFNLITKASRYKKALHCKSAYDCIYQIRAGGYATSPTYVENVMKIIKSNNLTTYDHVETVENNVNNQTSSEDEKSYIVQKGDTLSQIASKYRTTYQKLAEYNHIENPNLIYPGQVIKIPEGTDKVIAQCTYTVKKGDTLSSIAERYKMTWKKLYEKNKDVIGDDPNLIYPGQKLVI